MLAFSTPKIVIIFCNFNNSVDELFNTLTFMLAWIKERIVIVIGIMVGEVTPKEP